MSIEVFSSLQFILSARVAKLVDARDLKSLGLIIHAGSSPAPGTIAFCLMALKPLKFYLKKFSDNEVSCEKSILYDRLRSSL